MKKVSAIIVNWNGKCETADCIESLLKQDYPDLEIIVSDNGSTDGSIELIREKFPGVTLLENGKNLGFGAAVNRGLATASGDYFIFLNNDLVLKSNCIDELSNLLDSDEQIGAAVPKILYHEKPDTLNSFGVLIHYTGIACPNRIDQNDHPDLELTETACGGIFMFPRNVYNTVGGFDEDLFLYHEDHDLSWRIRLLGWKIMVTPDAVCYHHYKFNKGIKKFYSSEKNRLHILLKNLEWKTVVLISPGLIVVEMAQWIHSVLHGWFFLKIRSYLELISEFPDILKKRRQVQSIREINDSKIAGLYEGNLAVAGVNHPLMEKLLRPALNAYWKLIKGWI